MLSFKELEQICGCGIAHVIADRCPNLKALIDAMEQGDPWLDGHLSPDVREKLRAKLGLRDHSPTAGGVPAVAPDAKRYFVVAVRGIPRAEVGGDFLCGACEFSRSHPKPMYAGRCNLFGIMRLANTDGEYVRCSQCMRAEAAGERCGKEIELALSDAPDARKEL